LLILTGVVVLVAHLACAAEVAPIPLTGKIRWIYSYAEGQKQARESGKPMFVVFRCER
jgi:hypothetical protein